MRYAKYATCLLGLVLIGCQKNDQNASATSATQASEAAAPAAIKIGFMVKQPEEPWFEDEWKFAQKAADKDGFQLVTIGATDGGAVLAGIDNLGAQGAQGVIICTPDVRLGPAIVMRAKRYNMKVFAVDDRFLGPDGKPMEDVPYMGISAANIGRTVGRELANQMQKRGWKASETGACVPTRDELQTAKERTDGAIEALAAAGFPKDQIYTSSQKTTDIPGGRDAANIVLTQHPEVKHWLVAGMNDEAVLGAVRAMENRGFTADNIIGIGIGGDTGKTDFEKPNPTGFYASVLLSPKRHGEETADMMYHWIKDGKEPPMATFTTGILITRDNYKKVMAEQGL
ncbi:MAG TPA: arabinose ABC transporter substrate-binding protein [Tepidisphaeraceae bacterium]|jgi:L-arabinose transport system substrate-binding protein